MNIGPVHLERMRTLDAIVAAKAEIFEQAVTTTAVLNVDAHGLAPLADRLAAQGKRVIRVSAHDTTADVAVVADADADADRGDADQAEGALDVWVQGQLRHRIAATTAQPANVASALGIVVALDLPLEVVLPRLDSLPESDHRQQVVTSASGVTVIDNTFSSNPASADDVAGAARAPGRAAVAARGGHARHGRARATSSSRPTGPSRSPPTTSRPTS